MEDSLTNLLPLLVLAIISSVSSWLAKKRAKTRMEEEEELYREIEIPYEPGEENPRQKSSTTSSWEEEFSEVIGRTSPLSPETSSPPTPSQPRRQFEPPPPELWAPPPIPVPVPAETPYQPFAEQTRQPLAEASLPSLILAAGS